MSLRSCLSAMAAVALALELGCCCKAPWPCGDTYYGTHCGCKYWNEWFSHKPCCCDPCDFCGDFTCSGNPYVVNGPPYTRFGELYSDGSGYSGAGSSSDPFPRPTASPTPATPDSAPAEPAPIPDSAPEATPEMSPMEELPGPTTMGPAQQHVRRMAWYGGPVDSGPRSRTLGRPPRARLFAR
jgi:hypothetical protein